MTTRAGCTIAVFIAAVLSGPAHASEPDIPAAVTELIAGARADAAAGNALWPGYAEAPFGFLYVDPRGEVLLCDDREPAGFKSAPRNERLDCPVAVGPSSWRKPSLLAAMPVFGPPSVVVMGPPEASGRSAELWRLTVLHEHFHQWQSALPRYYERVAELDLANGDETGMWMLNYPFPYDSPGTGAVFKHAARLLKDAVEADEANLVSAVRAYLDTRKVLEHSVADVDWRYYEFQLWQEGVARWSEIAIGEMSIDPATALEARMRRQQTLNALEDIDLATGRRETAYAFGAAEAMLLERIDPDWRGCYRVSLSIGQCWEGLVP